MAGGPSVGMPELAEKFPADFCRAADAHFDKMWSSAATLDRWPWLARGSEETSKPRGLQLRLASVRRDPGSEGLDRHECRY